jgi:hypothetical protein
MFSRPVARFRRQERLRRQGHPPGVEPPRRTVDESIPHSKHTYFLRPGDIACSVEMRNGSLDCGGRGRTSSWGALPEVRSRGENRVARLVAPVTLRSATYTSAERIEASTSEQWDDRLYNRDGSVARVAPGHVEQRYVLQRVGSGWLIVDSQLERS